MSFYNYSNVFESEKSARSQGYDLNASYKDLTQVAAAVKGRPVAAAEKLLEDCIELRRPLPFKKFAKGLGHRSQLGGKKGKFPKKECKLVLQLLENAVANAKNKGLEEEKIFVLHACAYKQNVLPRYRKFFAGGNTLGYGKYALYSAYTTARFELVVGEKQALRKESTPWKRVRESKKLVGEKKQQAGKQRAEKKSEEKQLNEKPVEKKPEKKQEADRDAAENKEGEKKVVEKIVAEKTLQQKNIEVVEKQALEGEWNNEH